MKSTRTFLILIIVAIFLLSASGCRLGSRRLSNETAAPAQAGQPAVLQPTQGGAQPEDDELQDLIDTLDQLDRENQAADPLEDLP